MERITLNILVLLFYWISVIGHETGHILAGRLVGVDFGTVYMGPAIINMETRKVTLNKPFSLNWFFGMCSRPYFKGNLNNLVQRFAFVAFGGPATSIFFGVVILIENRYSHLGLISLAIGIATLFSDGYMAVLFLKNVKYGEVILLDTIFNSWESTESLRNTINHSVRKIDHKNSNNKLEAQIKAIYMKHIVSGIISPSIIDSSEILENLEKMMSSGNKVNHSYVEIINYYIIHKLQSKDELDTTFKEKYLKFLEENTFKDKDLNLECSIVSSLIQKKDIQKYVEEIKKLNEKDRFIGYELFWLKIINSFQ